MKLRFINPIALTHDVRVQVISSLPLEYMAVYEAKKKHLSALLASGFWEKVEEELPGVFLAVDEPAPWDMFTAVHQIDDELARAIWDSGFTSFEQIRESVDLNGMVVLTDLPGVGEKRAMLLYEHSRGDN